MVPGAGLEPARSFPRGILSPLCLPIPPPGPGYCAKKEAGLEAKIPANVTGKGPLTSNQSFRHLVIQGRLFYALH